MKICWDNLEKVRLTCYGNFKKGQTKYIEKESCKQCGDPYLTTKHNVGEYCCIACTKLGKHRPKEVRRKISETHKLRGLSKGKNNPMYGRKFSKEHREKMSNSLKGKYSGKAAYWYGKKLSQETKKKISESRIGKLVGPDNPNWKGGISCEPYCDVWTDKEYKESIKQRDGNMCLNSTCLHNSKRLGIHHIDYDKKNCKPNNLITLCTSCNSRANSDRNWHKSWYQAIIKKRYGGK